MQGFEGIRYVIARILPCNKARRAVLELLQLVRPRGKTLLTLVSLAHAVEPVTCLAASCCLFGNSSLYIYASRDMFIYVCGVF